MPVVEINIFIKCTDKSAVSRCTKCCYLGLRIRVLSRGYPYPFLSFGSNNIV
jgi:hypothetical protein